MAVLFVNRKPPAMPVVPKSFSYAQSRRSDMPPSDEGGGFAAGESGGREIRKEKFSPPVTLPRDRLRPRSQS